MFAFDMDGTLLPGTSACRQIARVAGVEDGFRELDVAFVKGSITGVEFARAIASLWDCSDSAMIRHAFDAAPKIGNIDAALRLISDHGGRACLITLAPQYFAEHFRAFGFHHIVASRFPLRPGRSIRNRAILTPEDKVTRLRRICCREGLTFDEAVVFGDSATDLPLFSSMRWSVCLNGSRQLQKAAWQSYVSDNLVDVLERVLDQLEECGNILRK
jgi:phosphoserine phosphatase